MGDPATTPFFHMQIPKGNKKHQTHLWTSSGSRCTGTPLGPRTHSTETDPTGVEQGARCLPLGCPQSRGVSKEGKEEE